MNINTKHSFAPASLQRSTSSSTESTFDDVAISIQSNLTTVVVGEAIAEKNNKETGAHITPAEDNAAEGGGRKRAHEEVAMTAMECVEERRAKNRLSAHQSRLRKRRQLKYLQNQVMVLTEDMKKLKSTNETKVHELAVARTQNAQLKAAQQDAMRLVAALRASQNGMLGGGAGLFHPSFHNF